MKRTVHFFGAIFWLATLVLAPPANADEEFDFQALEAFFWIEGPQMHMFSEFVSFNIVKDMLIANTAGKTLRNGGKSRNLPELRIVLVSKKQTQTIHVSKEYIFFGKGRWLEFNEDDFELAKKLLHARAGSPHAIPNQKVMNSIIDSIQGKAL